MKRRGARSRIETLSRFTVVGALCAFIAGMFSARASGSLSAGVRAGAIACALAATIVFFVFALGRGEVLRSRLLPLLVQPH